MLQHEAHFLGFQKKYFTDSSEVDQTKTLHSNTQTNVLKLRPRLFLCGFTQSKDQDQKM